MNDIHKITVTITLDAWQPFQKHVDAEIEDLIMKIKLKQLLAHGGNVKTRYEQERIQTGDE